ncbi:MAG: hypothetical protein ACTS3F_05365 [Phycisphaerales bacterium]
MNLRRGLRAWCVIACAGVCGAWGVADATIIKKDFNGFNDYDYRIIFMPDLDQRRTADTPNGIAGLPGNGGMYCVPTSTVNMMIYAANHGFPGVSPGSGNFALQTNYALATSTIADMGQEMGTTAGGGTGSTGWTNGVSHWLANESGADNGKLTYTNYLADGNYSPTLPNMVNTARKGSLVSFAYGFYDIVGTHNGASVISRAGGHIVTLVRARATTNQDHEMWIRDPADDNANLTTQSVFQSNHRTVLQRFVYTSANDNAWRLVSHITNLGSASNWRIIDQYVAIRPKEGYAFKSGLGSLVIRSPYSFVGVPTLAIDLSAPILDAVPAPDPGQILALLDSVPRRLVLVDTEDGEAGDLLEFPGAKALAFGRKRELYVSDGAKLYLLNYDDGLSPGPAISTIGNPTAMAYDDKNDRLIVLSTTNRTLSWVPGGFQSGGQTFSIPTPVPLSGDGSVAVMSNGNIWVVSPASNSLFEFTIANNQLTLVSTVNVPGNPAPIVSPTGITCDDAGDLFVCTGGGVKHLTKTAIAGWQVVGNSPFAGAQGTRFFMTRSRTNFDPLKHTGPGWENIEAPFLDVTPFEPECPGDLNADLKVDSDDLGILLSGFANPNGPDLNNDGASNSDDLNILLSAFGTVCD